MRLLLRRTRMVLAVAAVAAVAALAFGAVAAYAGTSMAAARSGDGGSRAGETALTGETAEKVKAAALARVPGGTVRRAETDADGAAYEAHVTRADGSEVVVKLDKQFNVTSVQEGSGRDGRGDCGDRGDRERGGSADDAGTST
jgi:hypothetical protein